MKEIVVRKADGNQRLNKFLLRLMPQAGEAFLYKMLRKKNILLNGRRAQGGEILREGDCLQIYFSDETFAKFAARKEKKRPAPPMPPVVFENEDILIVDKPAGMLTQADASGEGSLADALLVYADREAADGHYRFAPLHRLDKNTSGLVLCAKTLHAAQQMTALIGERRIKKQYLALVLGTDIADGRRIGFWKAQERKVLVAEHEAPGFLPVETGYETLEEAHGLSLVSAELFSGRKHQIRAQLASLGHPIIGDPLYGDAARNESMAARYFLKRQLLHADRIVFPSTEQLSAELSGQSFSARLPQDFLDVLKGEGFDAGGR